MKAIIITILIVVSQIAFSQQVNSGAYTGRFFETSFQNGVTVTKIVTNAQLYSNSNKTTVIRIPQPVSGNNINASSVRWTFAEPASIGEFNSESGNGQKSVVGWYLNNMRTQAFGNTNNTPLWTFTLPNQLNYVYVNSNAAGDKVANGFYHNIDLLNGSTGTSVYTFDVTTLSSQANAGPVAITSTGDFFIGSANVNTTTDTSYVIGFNGNTHNVVWRLNSPPGVGGSAIQGIKISGNDSLAIINAYLNFWVVNTYTGQVRYTGSVNPVNNNGTQTSQGISGNGNIIATINYIGIVRVYQWNGSTYSLMWQHQEPPGTFYNWMSAVDVTNDGSKVAIGTLQFVTSSSYDGKVKLFSVTGGSTPLWVYSGMGDEVAAVSFSKTGRIFSACSWGNYQTLNDKNLLVFNTTVPDSIPIFGVLDPGSFFWCSTSYDGTTVLGSGKAVHARNFGSGGMAYNIFVDTSANPTGIRNANSEIPKNYSLSQNYPNPFNPSTRIDYAVPKAGQVTITLYDIMGRKIEQLVNSYHPAGYYSTVLNANNLASGMYFYKIEASGFVNTKKMILLK